MPVVNPSKAEVSLTIQAEGVEDAQRVRDAIRAVKQEQQEQAKVAKELAAAQAQAEGRFKTAASAATGLAHVVKDATGGMGQFGQSVGGIVSMFGPWGVAIGGAIALAGQLFETLTKGDEALKANEEQINRLAAAYRAMGDSASYAGAQEKLRQEQVAEDTAKEVILRQQELNQVQQKIYKYEQEIHQIREMQAHAVDSMKDVYDRQVESVVKALQKERDRKYQLEEYLQGEEEALAAQRQLREQAEDQESEHQHRVEAERERLAKKREAEEQAKRTAEHAAEERQKRAANELQALAKLRLETEQAIIETSGVGQIEQVEREYARKKELAEAEYSDAVRRQQALDQIETQRVLAVAKKREEVEQALAKRASSITAASATPTSEEGKALAAWQAQREKLMAGIQQLRQLQADYEKEFGEGELAQSMQYLQIKDQEKQAAQQLADAELASYGAISAARAKDLSEEQDAIYEKVYAEHALTKAQKAAASAATTAFSEMSAGLEAWGISSTAIQKAQMLASGIQAGADAIDYGARAMAFFATGNPVAGTGMMAAAAGKTAAAAAYAAGLADLGGGAAPRSASSPAGSVGSYSSGSLTGAAQKESNDITINFAFEGSDNQIAGALIRGLNMSSSSLGHQKLKKSLISQRV